MPPFPNQELQQGALLSALQQQLQGRQYNASRPQGNGLENFQLFAGILNNFGNPNALPQTLGLIQEQRNRREDNARNDFLLETKLLETKLQAAQDDIKLRKQLINFDLEKRLAEQGLERGAFNLQQDKATAPLELRQKQAAAEGAEFSLGEARTLAPIKRRQEEAQASKAESDLALAPLERILVEARTRTEEAQERAALAQRNKLNQEIKQADQAASLAHVMRENLKRQGYDTENPLETPEFARLDALLTGIPNEAAQAIIPEDRITHASRFSSRVAALADLKPEPIVNDQPNPVYKELITLAELYQEKVPLGIKKVEESVITNILPTIPPKNRSAQKEAATNLVNFFAQPEIFDTYEQAGLTKRILTDVLTDITGGYFDAYKVDPNDLFGQIKELVLRRKQGEQLQRQELKEKKLREEHMTPEFKKLLQESQRIAPYNKF